MKTKEILHRKGKNVNTKKEEFKKESLRIKILILTSMLFILKIFDIFITIIALYFKALEQNPLGNLYYTNPYLMTIISFLPIIALSIISFFYKRDMFVLKLLGYASLVYVLVLILIVISNLCQLTFILN